MPTFPGKEAIWATLEQVRSAYAGGRSRPLEYRLDQLRRLASFLVERRAGLIGALTEDFKCEYEAEGEVRALTSEVVRAIDSLASWSKAKSVSAPLAFYLDSCTIRYEPLGVALIIAPWNYPVDLLVEPLIGAIAAGCAAVLKPSEVAGRTARFLADHLPLYLDQECFAIVCGGPEETGWLLDWPRWDLIFYTGSGRVGRIIQQKASLNLIPTVMELGGKSPCIVTASVDLGTTAKRIVWGKFFNAGQTCVAPDYVLATSAATAEALQAKILETIRLFYGPNPSTSPDYSRIVNDRHWDRLAGMLQGETGRATAVGDSDRKTRYFAPTVVMGPSLEGPLMSDEIFGPILPIVAVAGLDAAIDFVRGRDKPLALYLFTQDREEVECVLGGTSSGGCLVNDTMMHVFSGVFPLGGVGPSGSGRYKGRWSFEAFSHQKPVMWRSIGGEWINDNTRNLPMTAAKLSRTAAALFSDPRGRHLLPSQPPLQDFNAKSPL